MPAAAARWLSGILLVALAAACHADGVTGLLPEGPWGGPQGTLSIYPDSATLDLPCAIGRIPGPLVPATDGSLQVDGFYAVQAGPIGIGGATWLPAHFTGKRDGDRIQLMVGLAGQDVIGPLTFERGVVRTFPRCL